MPGSLRTWYDPLLEVDEMSTQTVKREQARRLLELSAMAASAGLIPRRLGADATREELAGDKKLCKQISAAAISIAQLWDHTAAPTSGMLKSFGKEGAQVVWNVWWLEHQSVIRNQKAWIATWATKYNHRTEGNRMLATLEKEELWLSRLFP